jgi:large subunit ribosomal protein L4
VYLDQDQGTIVLKSNKKVKALLARKSALAYKVQAERLYIVEDFSMEHLKLKNSQTILNNLKIS